MDSRKKKMVLFGGIAAAVLLIAVVVLVIMKVSNKQEAYRNIEVLEVSGESVVYRNDKEIAAYESMKLRSGDTLSVDEGAYLRMKLDKDKYVYLEGAALINLIAEGTEKDSKTIVNIELGTMVTEVQNKLSDKSSYEINAPNTTMAIRGTITVTEVGYDLEEQQDEISQEALLQFVLERSGYVKKEVTANRDTELDEMLRTLEAAFEQGVDVNTSNYVQEGNVQITAFEKKEDADGKSCLVAVQLPVDAGNGFAKTVSEKDSVSTLLLTQIRQDEKGDWNISEQTVDSIDELQEVMNTWNIVPISSLDELQLNLNLNSSSISGDNLSGLAVWNETQNLKPTTEASPTEEPVVTEEPEPTPTEAPVVTEEPEPSPTEAPVVTEEPEPTPTEAPVVTEEPEPTPTEAPVVTEAPQPTEAPVVTEAPQPTEAPVVTEAPQPTEAPVVTEAPQPTEAPVVTEAPQPTEAPVVTEAPQPTEAPVVTEAPQPTEVPAITETPSPTQSPGSGDSGAGTGGGGTSASPTPIPSPDPTTTPDPTQAPTPSVMPENPSDAYEVELMEGDNGGYRLLAVKSEYQGLQSVTIPSKIGDLPVMEVDAGLLQDCSDVKTIVIDSGFEPGAQASVKDDLTSAIAQSNTVDTIVIAVDDIEVLDFSAINSLKTLELQVIAGGVNTLAAESFIGNSSIEKLILKGALLEIGESAFKQCTKLKEVVIERPEGNTDRLNLFSWAFAECTSLESIDLSSVATIPYGAFENCTSLSNVTMPNETYSIGNNAFAGCKLTSIDLTNVGTLGSAAFSGCEFTSISLPSTMEVECAWDAFYGCKFIGIENPYVEPGTGLLYTAEMKEGADMPSAVICSYLYPELIVAEGEFTELEIPDYLIYTYSDENGELIEWECSVTEIADGVFAGVQHLKSVSLPWSMENIGVRAFADCTNLTYVQGGGNVLTIDDEAFSGCSKLESVAMNASIESGADAFCITLPNELTSLGERVFDGCDSLKGGVYFPMYSETEEFFTADSFAGVSGITGIEGYCSGAGYKIPDSAFKGMTSLEYVNLRGVVSIGASAFENCTGLKEVSLFSSSVVHPEAGSESELGAKAFAGCTAITQLEVEGFTTIANDAFEGVTALYTYEALETGGVKITGFTVAHSGSGDITIPDTINDMPVYEIGESAFEYSTITGVTIGKNVRKIDDYAFYFCSSLKTIEFPEGLESIGSSAFAASGLTSVILPDSVTSIGTTAFNNCTSLTSVKLSAGLTEIAMSTFDKNVNLTSVVIPNGVRTIDQKAFNGCNNLGKLVLPASVQTIYSGAFKKTNTIGVPALTTYLHQAQITQTVPTMDGVFSSTEVGDHKVYAVSGSGLQCVTNPIPETQIVKLDGTNSKAHDALEVSIMQEIGAVNAEYLFDGAITINVPETVASFEYGPLKNDGVFSEDLLDSVAWSRAQENSIKLEVLTEWIILCFRIKETENSDYIYLVTPKLKSKQ